MEQFTSDPGAFFAAFWTTIQLTIYAGIGALVIGTVLAAMRLSPVPVLNWLGTAYVNVVRNTPLTLIILFCSLGLATTLKVNTSPIGQAEAARSLGLSFSQNLTSILLPQAFRATIIPMGSVLIALTKNTTIASVIGVAEAALLMSEWVENSSALLLVGSLFAVGFVVLTLPLGLLFGWLGKRLAVAR